MTPSLCSRSSLLNGTKEHESQVKVIGKGGLMRHLNEQSRHSFSTKPELNYSSSNPCDVNFSARLFSAVRTTFRGLAA
jgi:hypothetical protein